MINFTENYISFYIISQEICFSFLFIAKKLVIYILYFTGVDTMILLTTDWMVTSILESAEDTVISNSYNTSGQAVSDLK